MRTGRPKLRLDRLDRFRASNDPRVHREPAGTVDRGMPRPPNSAASPWHSTSTSSTTTRLWGIGAEQLRPLVEAKDLVQEAFAIFLAGLIQARRFRRSPGWQAPVSGIENRRAWKLAGECRVRLRAKHANDPPGSRSSRRGRQGRAVRPDADDARECGALALRPAVARSASWPSAMATVRSL